MHACLCISRNHFNSRIVCLFVCFITKSFLTYSFLSPAPALLTISRPLSSSMCSITPETANVGSSYNRMRGPCIGCWFSDRSNCSHWSSTLTFTLTSENLSLYTTLLFYWPLYNYAAQAADILNQTTVVQGVDSHCWGLYCRRCYCTRLCWGRSSRTFHFFTLTWPAKHSPNQGVHTQVTPLPPGWCLLLPLA